MRRHSLTLYLYKHQLSNRQPLRGRNIATGLDKYYGFDILDTTTSGVSSTTIYSRLALMRPTRPLESESKVMEHGPRIMEDYNRRVFHQGRVRSFSYRMVSIPACKEGVELFREQSSTGGLPVNLLNIGRTKENAIPACFANNIDYGVMRTRTENGLPQCRTQHLLVGDRLANAQSWPHKIYSSWPTRTKKERNASQASSKVARRLLCCGQEPRDDDSTNKLPVTHLKLARLKIVQLAEDRPTILLPRPLDMLPNSAITP